MNYLIVLKNRKLYRFVLTSAALIAIVLVCLLFIFIVWFFSTSRNHFKFIGARLLFPIGECSECDGGIDLGTQIVISEYNTWKEIHLLFPENDLDIVNVRVRKSFQDWKLADDVTTTNTLYFTFVSPHNRYVSFNKIYLNAESNIEWKAIVRFHNDKSFEKQLRWEEELSKISSQTGNYTDR